MHAIFQKELGNGKVHMHFDLDWDVLKYELTKLDTFDEQEWDSARYAIEALWNGHIVSDGVCLWQHVDMTREPTDFSLFEGSVVLLNEIDPVFDGT